MDAPQMTQSIAKKTTPGAALEQHLELLYRVANQLTNNTTKAEDLVSETISVVFKYWHTFDGQHPKSWLIKVLRNQFLLGIRKDTKHQHANIEDVAEPADNNFWQAIERNLESEHIRQALEQLTDDYKEIVVLCDVEELTYEEAASILEIPIGTVRSRLFRGRKLLRSKLLALAKA
jgi:RNA polymerase sigma-70 factor (ECF subfamily)